MKLERIESKNVLVPENKLDREILQYLLVHMKPDGIGYWDVIYNGFDPMGADDWQGRVYVSWEGEDRARQLDPFSVIKDQDGGYLRVVKMSKLPNQH
ncbi:MAG: hypothetical protein JWN40_1086 [Phycisphaerales bacterium]|nr:hypothetical protein [Phycisphaerales bacterium]